MCAYGLSEMHEHLLLIIDNTDPHRLTAFFKEHARLSASIFRGFRIGKIALENSIVRQRIVSEAKRTPPLMGLLCNEFISERHDMVDIIRESSVNAIKQKLPDLVAQYGALPIKVALSMDARKSAAALAKHVDGDLLPAVPQEPPTCENSESVEPDVQPSQETTHELENIAELKRAYREKCQKYRERIDGLEQELKKTQDGCIKKDSDIKLQRDRILELERAVTKGDKIRSRLQRDISSLQRENDELHIRLKAAQKKIESIENGAPQNQERRAITAPKMASNWGPVVDRMVSDKHYDAAIAFCGTVCELEPENPQPHMALGGIYNAINDNSSQAQEFIWLAKHFADKRKYKCAISYVIEAIGLQPEIHDSHTLFRNILSQISVDDKTAMNKIAARIRETRVHNNSAYKCIKKLLNQMGTQYSRILVKETELHADKVLCFKDGKESRQLSVNDIIKAISSNDANTVDFVRRALIVMKRSDSERQAAVQKTINRIDESYLYVLRGDNMPVVVDGSNVAWHNQGRSSNAHIRNIHMIRNELRYEGYFPIYIYIDAALIYQIDHKSELQKMIDTGEVLSADGATSADTLVIDKARVYNCPIVTNDRMKEWDPEDSIKKIRFNIDDNGVSFGL